MAGTYACPQSPGLDSISTTLAYHERTKHHLDRYARSLGYLDWATQPDPFRVFAGAQRVELPLAADGLPTLYEDLYVSGAVPPRAMNISSIGIFFELSLGISAWKEFQGSRWALRCNPSSGNLHPTEGYGIFPVLPGLEAGVYHYISRDHCLERRCSLSSVATADLVKALPAGTFVIGLSSIHWREAWKYGERAFRYCQHDIGHAIAALRFAAAALGWTARLLDHFGDEDVESVLGLNREADFAGLDPLDREHPDALIVVSREAEPALMPDLPIKAIQDDGWAGQANALSSGHVGWDAIDAVTAATRMAATASPEKMSMPALPVLFPSTCRAGAANLIRQRRSCQALDGKTSLSAETFYRMLDSLLPRQRVAPWDVLPWPPQVHVGIFVHRVRGLTPGLYVLERCAAIHERLRAALKPTFLWERPADCPQHLAFYRLMIGDLRRAARVVSCNQEIASDGAFSLGMIADFNETIQAKGAWWYRRLFWETGVLGQVLYLEAEAAGVRGTGIGCFFDDEFHEVLGLKDTTFQDLYHFTVGGSLDDRRLTTLPPYGHLKGR